MLHTPIKVNFKNYEPFEQLNYDLNLIHNTNDLCRFVKTHYNQDYATWETENFDQSYKQYQSMINYAIQSNCLEAVEILWQGIYFHDCDHPDYNHDVYIAAESSNIETLQHILYAYMNYMTFEIEPIEYKKLKTLALNNKPVLDFVIELESCVDYCGYIVNLMLEDDSNDSSSEDDNTFRDRKRKFKACIEKYK